MLNFAISPESVLPLPRPGRRSSTTAVWPGRLAIGRFLNGALAARRRAVSRRPRPASSPVHELDRTRPPNAISGAAQVSSTADSHLRTIVNIVESTIRRSINATDCHERAAVHVDAAMYELLLLRQEFESMTKPASRPA